MHRKMEYGRRWTGRCRYAYEDQKCPVRLETADVKNTRILKGGINSWYLKNLCASGRGCSSSGSGLL